MPREEWGGLQLKYQKHLEIAKIGLSGMLGFLGIGIAASWYAFQNPAPVWAASTALIGCIGALVIGILSFIHFRIYLRDLSEYATAVYGPWPAIRQTPGNGRSNRRTTAAVNSLPTDVWNEVLREFFLGLGIACITLVALRAWTENVTLNKLSPWNSLLIFGAGLACLILAALLKFDTENDSRLNRLNKWSKFILIIFTLLLVLGIWFIIVQPLFP